ncbi:MAG TPA: hypothetical protein PKL29_08195 [Methanothrix sp.]|jgi:hypothetical protein|nr:hypothetical protein [Methanothrix sp.]HPT37565.1 hypothetical protein [Methanothrix sp.]
MRSIIALALLLSFVPLCMALSPVEQAYVNGVNDGVKLGKAMADAEQYNTLVQQFNDKINQTFGANASIMLLPMMPVNNTATAAATTYSSTKPVHKMDGTPAETTVMQL